MPYVLFLLIVTIWSSSFILMKKAALVFSPESIALWRVVGGAAVLGVLGWQRRELAVPERRTWWVLAPVMLLGYAWPYVVQPFLVSRDGSAFVALSVSLVPLLTILLSIPVLGVWPSVRQTLGVCGALACMGLLLADGLDRQIPLSDMGLAASIPASYAVTNTLIRRWLRDLSPLSMTFHSLAVTGGLLVPLAWRAPAPATAADPSRWPLAIACLVVLGVLGTGLAMYWFNHLIREHGPLFAGMTTNVVPIGAVLWGWADREQISARQCLALAGIMAMVALVQFRAAARA